MCLRFKSYCQMNLKVFSLDEYFSISSSLWPLVGFATLRLARLSEKLVRWHFGREHMKRWYRRVSVGLKYMPVSSLVSVFVINMSKKFFVAVLHSKLDSRNYIINGCLECP